MIEACLTLHMKSRKEHNNHNNSVVNVICQRRSFFPFELNLKADDTLLFVLMTSCKRNGFKRVLVVPSLPLQFVISERTELLNCDHNLSNRTLVHLLNSFAFLFSHYLHLVSVIVILN